MTGRAALGPILHKEFATFVGRQPIAQAHGMTVAELARLFQRRVHPASPVPLETVPMSGWKRSEFFDASRAAAGSPPSPNMPTPECALVYSRHVPSFEGHQPVGGARHHPARSS